MLFSKENASNSKFHLTTLQIHWGQWWLWSGLCSSRQNSHHSQHRQSQQYIEQKLSRDASFKPMSRFILILKILRQKDFHKYEFILCHKVRSCQMWNVLERWDTGDEEWRKKRRWQLHEVKLGQGGVEKIYCDWDWGCSLVNKCSNLKMTYHFIHN